MNIRKNLRGFHWQFPGGAETSYSRVIRKIQENSSLSEEEKNDLIEEVTYLCGHIINDADFQIRNRYASALSSGIKYLKFDLFPEPSAWIKKIFFAQFRDIYASSTLESLRLLNNVTTRIERTANRILNS